MYPGADRLLRDIWGYIRLALVPRALLYTNAYILVTQVRSPWFSTPIVLHPQSRNFTGICILFLYSILFLCCSKISILCNKGVKKYPRVAYDILRNSVRKLQHNTMRSLRYQSGKCGYIGGKRECTGVRSGYRGSALGGGAGGEAPPGGGGGSSLTDQNFFIIGICAILCHPNTESL